MSRPETLTRMTPAQIRSAAAAEARRGDHRKAALLLSVLGITYVREVQIYETR